MIAVDSAIAFGGLCQDYIDKETGEITIGCSVITLLPHPKLKLIHSKASPMMLPQDPTMDSWLDPDNHNIEAFQPLLAPAIKQDLEATKIDKPSSYVPIAKPFLIPHD